MSVDSTTIRESEIEPNRDESDEFEGWETADSGESVGEILQRNSLRKGMLKAAKMNWEFPTFPTSNDDTLNNTKTNKYLSRQCCHTQTENKDWALLELRTNNEQISEPLNLCSEQNEDLKPDIIIVPTQISKKKHLMDKGTSSSDLPGDLDYAQKLEKLKQDFEKASDSHIKELLDACYGDYNWAYNLLCDFNEEHFSENIIIDKKDEREANVVGEKSMEASPIKMRMDPIFASKLEQMFGQFKNDGPFSEDDLTITLTKGMAKIIYHLWKQSQPNFYNMSYKKNLKENTKQKKADNPIKNVWENKMLTLDNYKNYEPKNYLQEIMDFEMALNLSWDEYYNSFNGDYIYDKNLLSTKMKREQLFASYPGIERQILEELFESNNFKLSETITAIDETIGIMAEMNPQTEAWVTAEIIQNRVCSRRFSNHNQNETFSEETSPEFNELREQMLGYWKLRKTFSEKAKDSYNEKRYAIAGYYSGEARRYQKMMHEMSHELIQNVLSANQSKTLDLHGLHSSEVLITLTSFIALKKEEMKRRKLNKMKLEIITGWGAHSKVAPRIKPIVLNYLQSKKYNTQSPNQGTIRITLTQ